VQRLAAQLTFSGVQMSDPAAMIDVARVGVGGVTLYGRPGPRLAADLAAARRASAVAPFVASDEEGGEVQRLSTAIYPLPSAEQMGTWSDARISAVAYDYATRMRHLGVTMDFAPVADLATPGHYIALLHRSFSADPDHVARAVTAWNAGLHRAGVLGVVKHWPGHGAAGNTHTGSASVPSLQILAGRDMRPFAAAFAAGTPAVMVGHLRVPGLTLGREPASESAVALRYLRSVAGPTTLILTDDLSMAAASHSLGITPAAAAVRALQAGADMALVAHGQVRTVIAAIAAAIASGALPRDRAVASARRILAVKQAAGLVT
jgi:beta-N-acetylhexosaminidase